MVRRAVVWGAVCAIGACSSRSEVPRAGDGPPGDYGDAPEGKALYPDAAEKTASFPTRTKDGARVLDTEVAWLGSAGSVERGAEDPNDPDGRPNLEYDRDDGLDEMFIDLEQGAARAELALDVASAKRSAKLWLNVLIDLNEDGQWGPEEWPVQNHEVAFEDTLRRRVELPPFRFEAAGRVPSRAWMRVALTDTLVPKPWDGRGQFGAGEIEDHLVEVPRVPLVDVDCENPSNSSGSWTFSGQRATSVTCRLEALNEAARSELGFVSLRKKGGVTHSLLCRGAKLDDDSTEREASGRVDLGKGSAEVSCLFKKEWGLPTDFSFEVRTGRDASKLTALGVEAGLSGANGDTFRLEKGECSRRCRSSRECFGNQLCSGDCCVPPWSAECADHSTTDCGRCCAITAGAAAADCVRSACAP